MLLTILYDVATPGRHVAPIPNRPPEEVQLRGGCDEAPLLRVAWERDHNAFAPTERVERTFGVRFEMRLVVQVQVDVLGDTVPRYRQDHVGLLREVRDQPVIESKRNGRLLREDR